MMSLLNLPQNVWRENVAFFLKDVVELVRLDSAVTNRSVRTAFLSNISGCKRFRLDQNLNGDIAWFVLRNMIVEKATFSTNLQLRDVLYLGQLLSQVKCVAFQKDSFSEGKKILLQPDWLRSNVLIDLSITSCDIEDLSALSVCANLRSLCLDECDCATTESFVVGIQRCPQLRMIYICECSLLRENAAIEVIRVCAELCDVSLHGHFDLTKIFEDIAWPTAITHLTCTDQTSMLPGSFLRNVGTIMPQIRSLELQYPQNAAAEGDVEAFVRSCDKLVSIQLYHYAQITNAIFEHTAQYMSRLQSICIDFCWSITDVGIITLAQYATNLTSLCLNGLLTITDAAIQAVGTHCKLLTCLDVSYCFSLTDSAFTTLNVAQLRRLNVSETAVTGTFAAHVFSEATSLRDLFCINCHILNADFVYSVPARYIQLVTLHLARITRLTESDWLQLSTKFPNLHALHISDTSAVNNVVVQSFKSNCPNLVNVTLTGCSVSDYVLNLFA